MDIKSQILQFFLISNDELLNYFKGYWMDPYYLEGKDELELHKQMALIMDEIVEKLQIIKADAKMEELEDQLILCLYLELQKDGQN